MSNHFAFVVSNSLSPCAANIPLSGIPAFLGILPKRNLGRRTGFAVGTEVVWILDAREAINAIGNIGPKTPAKRTFPFFLRLIWWLALMLIHGRPSPSSGCLPAASNLL